MLRSLFRSLPLARAAVVAAMLGVSSGATAGVFYVQTAWVSAWNWGGGGGGLLQTRATPDAVADVGCEAIAMWSSSYVVCWVADAVGGYQSCYSYDPNFVALAAGVNEASVVAFDRYYDGTCMDLVVFNASHNLPN